PAEYRGPFAAVPTRTPGVRFSELLPRLAARSDRFSLVRSHRTFHSGHLEAGTLGLTGAADAAALPPNFGSVVARQRPGRALPPFRSIGRGHPRDGVGPMKGYGGGGWGKLYAPCLVHCSDRGDADVPALKLLDGLTPQPLADRRALLSGLDGLRRRVEA